MSGALSADRPPGGQTTRAGEVGAILLVALLAVPAPFLLAEPAGASAPHRGISPLSGPSPAATVPITVMNSQASGTGTYQQMLVVNSASYSEFINSNWSNVAFRYPNGTPIYAWVEANNSNAATHTVVWLRLYNIPANSQQVVDMDIFGEFVTRMGLSGPTGEAPQLTTTYGAWDDGWRVFDLYENFSGTSLPTGWTISSAGAYTVSNGLVVSGGGGQSVYTAQTFTPVQTLDMYGSFPPETGSPNSNFGFSSPGGANRVSAITGLAIGGGTGWCYYAPVATMSPFIGPTVVTILWNSSTASTFTNYTHLAQSITSGVNGIATPVGGYAVTVGTAYTIWWVDLRVRPPAGVMPSTSFGPSLVYPPWSLAVTGVSSGTVALSWGNPPGRVVNDTIRVGTESGGNCVAPYTSVDTLGPATRFTVLNLLPSHAYCFTVQAWYVGFVGSQLAGPVTATTSGVGGGGGGGGGGTPPSQNPVVGFFTQSVDPALWILVAVFILLAGTAAFAAVWIDDRHGPGGHRG